MDAVWKDFVEFLSEESGTRRARREPMFDAIYNILVVVGAITLVAVAAVVVAVIEHLRRGPDEPPKPPATRAEWKP